jgi:phosphoribosylformylglycinamidine synthase
LIGVIQFPGSCDERDALAACERVGDARMVWHEETDLSGIDGIVVPGGFSYGDYLRAGAIARFAPAMGTVTDFAAGGGPVLGICNGFQVLCEAGLLPGALQKNRGLRFLCTTVGVRVETTSTVATGAAEAGEVLMLPINHFEGSYVCTPGTHRLLVAEERVVFRCLDNPNGSVDAIAGVCNEGRNVVGLMPHPERASHALLGSTDGNRVLAGFLSAAAGRGLLTSSD